MHAYVQAQGNTEEIGEVIVLEFASVSLGELKDKIYLLNTCALIVGNFPIIWRWIMII